MEWLLSGYHPTQIPDVQEPSMLDESRQEVELFKQIWEQVNKTERDVYQSEH